MYKRALERMKMTNNPTVLSYWRGEDENNESDKKRKSTDTYINNRIAKKRCRTSVLKGLTGEVRIFFLTLCFFFFDEIEANLFMFA